VAVVILLALWKYMFAQRRNRLTTKFSERTPIVKRRISVLSKKLVYTYFFLWYLRFWRWCCCWFVSYAILLFTQHNIPKENSSILNTSSLLLPAEKRNLKSSGKPAPFIRVLRFWTWKTNWYPEVCSKHFAKSGCSNMDSGIPGTAFHSCHLQLLFVTTYTLTL